MSITVDKSPPLVAISGNPVLFKLSTDNQFEMPGIHFVALPPRIQSILSENLPEEQTSLSMDQVNFLLK